MILTTPWALVLLLLLPVTAVVGYVRLRRLPGQRGPLALCLRLLVLALFVFALTGPQWRITQQRVAVVFLVDASASVGAAGQHAGMTWAARAVAAAGPLDQASMVLFGAAPRLAIPLAHYKALPDPADQPAGATDIGAALRLGLAMLPPGAVGRLVLLSDGQATTDDTADALALALQRRVPIDTVAITPPARRDVSVRALDVPGAARVGQSVPLRITLHSTYATQVTLTVWIDGQAARQTIALPSGDTVLGAEQRLDSPGVHTFRASIEAPGDAVPQNNSLDAVTMVGPPGRVLFVVSDPASAASLATALARARLTVLPTLAASLPHDASGYHNLDEVVLDNVPATSLSRAQQIALSSAVYNNGMGLLAIGGPDSFGAGGYANSPLEQALPVLSITTPHYTSAPVALMLVIDKSGSMADAIDGVAKVNMVKVAAASALDRLQVGDGIGVLAFDDSNHWIVPFHALQGATDKMRIRQQISTLSADGDTYIYPALQAAERAVVGMRTPYRHIVLLTDGQGEQADFDTLIRRMRREHITLSTIGVGQDVVQDELSHWAKLGGGRYHYVSDPHDIPRIVVNETRYGSAGSAEVLGHAIRLGVASASPLLRTLSGQSLPAISGYDSTAPKSTAQVAVQSATGDPILSSWQYGLGRAVVWTSDAGDPSQADPWASAWNATRLPSFWVDLAHWALRGYTAGAAAPVLQFQGGSLQISTQQWTASGAFDDGKNLRVRLVAPTGTARVTPLPLSGPGLYSARQPLDGPGVYTASFVRNDQGAPAPDAVAALAVPYSAEYADNGVNLAALTQLSAATGGSVLTRPADAFAHGGLPATAAWLPLWPILLALALLLFPLDVAARLLLPPDRRYQAK